MTHIDPPEKRFTAGEKRAVMAGRKGAKTSPWSRGPMACTQRAQWQWVKLHAKAKRPTK